jgi:hypothetical protein
VIGYSVVLVFLLGVLTFLLATRTDVDVTILRTPGMFYQEQPDGRISNVYDVKVLNKTFDTGRKLRENSAFGRPSSIVAGCSLSIGLPVFELPTLGVYFLAVQAVKLAGSGLKRNVTWHRRRA